MYYIKNENEDINAYWLLVDINAIYEGKNMLQLPKSLTKKQLRHFYKIFILEILRYKSLRSAILVI